MQIRSRFARSLNVGPSCAGGHRERDGLGAQVRSPLPGLPSRVVLAEKLEYDTLILAHLVLNSTGTLLLEDFFVSLGWQDVLSTVEEGFFHAGARLVAQVPICKCDMILHAYVHIYISILMKGAYFTVWRTRYMTTGVPRSYPPPLSS